MTQTLLELERGLKWRWIGLKRDLLAPLKAKAGQVIEVTEREAELLLADGHSAVDLTPKVIPLSLGWLTFPKAETSLRYAPCPACAFKQTTYVVCELCNGERRVLTLNGQVLP